MTDCTLSVSAFRRRRMALASLLAFGFSFVGAPSAATAAAIQSHAQPAHAQSTLSRDWSDVKSFFTKLENKVDGNPVVKDLKKVSLSGTYSQKDLPSFLQGTITTPPTPAKTTTTTAAAKPSTAAQILAHAETIAVQSQPPPLSISATTTPESAGVQVLSNGPLGASTPVAAAQFVAVPEPSTTTIACVLLAVAGGWKFRRARG
jgi:hypothetical protein